MTASLAEFGSVVDAVECAVALQRALAERNISVPEPERVQVRIGINLGEVIVEGDDRYGDGVNVAARLEQLAEPGGVYVSGKVAKEVEKKLAFVFESMGEQKIKNLAEPVAVYRIKLNGAPSRSRTSTTLQGKRWGILAAAFALILLMAIAAFYAYRQMPGQGPALPDKPSVAVLPFANMSDDPQQTYFADGIAENLMTDLSRLSGLFVIARNSAFAYKGKAVDVRQVAKELGVRYVVEGSVQRSGDQVRINVQLVDATTGGHQWAERYDGSHGDIFALQDKVTKAVVDAMALHLTPGERQKLGQHETAVPEAYDAFLRGWQHYQRTTPEEYAEAIPHFSRAIELDPSYGRAHAALAMIYFRAYEQLWAGLLGILTDQAFRRARDHLNLAKAHPTSTSYQVEGNISRQRGWYDEAQKQFQAAIALDPSNSWSYADLAYTLISAGRSAEATEPIEKAMRLDPHYPPVFVFYRGLIQFAQGQLPEAAKTFEEASRLAPNDTIPQLFLAATYGLSDRKEDAAAVIAALSAAEVRRGGVPFAMIGIQIEETGRLFKVPEKSRLIDGLNRAGIPYSFEKVFNGHQLTGAEIDALVFGKRLHGRSLDTGREHGASISGDGRTAMAFGDWTNGTGSAHIESDQLCFVWSSVTWCCTIYRNPGGTKAKENEFVLFIRNWPYTFSPVE